MLRYFALAAVIFTMAACAGRQPREEYTLANTAISAARTAQAPRYAPGLFSSAEDAYRKGVRAYDEGHYESAQRYFDHARHFAEQSENFTVLKKAETGEAN